MQTGMDTRGSQLFCAPHAASNTQGPREDQHEHCAPLHPHIPRMSNSWLNLLFQDTSPASESKGLIRKTKGW